MTRTISKNSHQGTMAAIMTRTVGNVSSWQKIRDVCSQVHAESKITLNDSEHEYGESVVVLKSEHWIPYTTGNISESVAEQWRTALNGLFMSHAPLGRLANVPEFIQVQRFSAGEYELAEVCEMQFNSKGTA